MGIPLIYFGTPEGTRTPNPRNRNPMLYPLSHRCMLHSLAIIAGFARFVKSRNPKKSRQIRHFFVQTVVIAAKL